MLAGAILCHLQIAVNLREHFTSNEAVGGNNSVDGAAGRQAEGGAISVYGANVCIDGSTFQSNVAGRGQHCSGVGLPGAAHLLGAMGLADNRRDIQLKFLNNQAIGGAGGVGNFYPIASSGGAILNLFGVGSLTFTNLDLEDNEVYGGDGGAWHRWQRCAGGSDH